MSIKGFLILLIVFQYFHRLFRFCSENCRKPVLLLLKPLNFTPFKKKLFLYAFLSSGLSLSRLLRFYIFSLVPTKKPLTFCFLVQFYSHVPVSIESPATRTFAFCCSCPWGHTCMTSKKNDQYFDPFPLPHPVSHSPSRLPLLLPPLTPMLKNEQ